MGAGTTEVRDTTTDVLLEAAVWDPAAVSRTQRRLHLYSEAGRRYERTVDPAISVAALDRCSSMLAEIAGGTVEPKLTDWRGDPPRDDWSQPPVSMAVDLPDRVAGVEYAQGTTEKRLTQIGADVVVNDGRVTATPPSWRPDLRQPADLVEEVLRLEGLEIIPSVLPSAPAGRGLSPTQKRRRAIGKSLALNGYVEILPTPFLPAGCSTSGASRQTIRAGRPPRCSIRWRPTVLSWPPHCCRGCWRRWRATCPAVPSTPRCTRSPRSSSRRRKPVRWNAFRPTVAPPRRDRDARRVAATSAAARRRRPCRTA